MAFSFGKPAKQQDQSSRSGSRGGFSFGVPQFGISSQPSATGFSFKSSSQSSFTECGSSSPSPLGISSGPSTTARSLGESSSRPRTTASSLGECSSRPLTTDTSTQSTGLELPFSGIAVRASEPSHGDLVLSSLCDLKDQDIVRDFTINVGDESFIVHRAVLAACSEYFRSMFKHDTKERQESAVYMEDVKAEAVKECIDYMYSGNADITVDTAGDILHAASLMQLEKLTEKCFEKIEDSLNSENCFKISGVLEIYSCDNLRKKVDLCIRNNFYDVIETEEFALKSLDNLLSFVSNFANNDEAAWKALKSWIKYNESERSQYMDELMKLIKLVQFPSANLLQSFANDSLVTADSPERLDLFLTRIFSSTSELEKNLNIKNCFIVRQLANEYKYITREAQNIIDKFLIDQYEQVLTQDEFVNLVEKDVLMIIGAQNIQCLASEELRWNAIINWLKYNSDRIVLAPEMMKNVDFSQLPKQFIQDTVRQEPLVKNSPECMTILMDGLLSTKQNYNTQTECIAALSENGLIHSFRLDENKSSLEIPTIPTGTGSRIFSFNGKLCLFNTTGIYYLGTNNKWIRKTVVQGVPPHSKVAVFKNMIYFISKDASCCYNTLNDIWNMDFPVCDGDVATLGNDIYAIQGEQETRVLNENGTEWHSIYRRRIHNTSDDDELYDDDDDDDDDDEEEEKVSLELSVSSFMGDIYAAKFGSKCLRRFSQQDSEWHDVSMVPGSAPEKACLFVADGKLIVLSKTSSQATLYAYDKICNQWMTLKVLPQATTVQKKIPECHNFSACSFKFES
uniref:uncharacterized protein LOC120327012 isoform X2 n=1 Tax=Styela clava TaxID=7725 RepID=UPI001939DFA7|nr:uncharacterized protein LOC120327012 isoform X2 [Styela clava]